MAERCVILKHSRAVAASGKHGRYEYLNPALVNCPHFTDCNGSTNIDDCRLVQERFPKGPKTDTKRFDFESQPAEPVVPMARFIRILEKHGDMVQD